MWPCCVKMPTQNLLKLLVLLMLMFRNVLTRFLSWSSGQILKLKFSHFFAADPWLRLWRLFLVENLKLCLVKILKFKFSWNAEIWLRFWSWRLVDILEMKFDQNLCKNFDDKRSYFGKQNSTLGSVLPVAMFSITSLTGPVRMLWFMQCKIIIQLLIQPRSVAQVERQMLTPDSI